MSTSHLFFICPICFEVCDSRRECHEHKMVCCDVIQATDERRKPVVDANGHVVSRAPRWFLEAIGGCRPKQAPDAA